ncbi:hypothetical protein AGOR_G00060350 [Albula goreensis]|uniref:Ig-like domain-containing protein n=1 Tax=Albula goreensis TaxID=1534307 RepID=A0A8T3DV77_9TELE|nr:hypothetical protein AGOR_G00060350 [Albula goreensis]
MATYKCVTEVPYGHVHRQTAGVHLSFTVTNMMFRDENIFVAVSLLVVLSITMSDAYRKTQLPIRGGCYQLSPEVSECRLQGEAVVLRCVFLEAYLKSQGFFKFGNYTSQFLRGNDSSSGVPIPAEDRVKEEGHRLWFLPAKSTDSGTYSCTFRNATYCFATTISVQVYEPSQPHLDAISYPMFAYHGRKGKLYCAHVEEFNITGDLQWYKESTPIVFSVNRTRYRRETSTSLTIQDVRPEDEGFYTCHMQVQYNGTKYTVTRVIKLSVTGPDPRRIPSTVRPSQSSVAVTAHRPKIVGPVNGTFFQSSSGSTLMILCKVSTGKQSADSTEVTWFINGLSVEEAPPSVHASLGERRVTTENGVNYIELELTLLELHEEDIEVEIKCVAQNQGGREEVMAEVKLEGSIFKWLLVASVGTVCFVTMASVFLYQLLKPKRKRDYILARQNSTFSNI